MHRDAKVILASAAVGILLVSGCGRTDPTTITTGSATDSTAVSATSSTVVPAVPTASIAVTPAVATDSSPDTDGWQGCPGGDLDASPQFSTWDFAVADIAPSNGAAGTRDVIVAKLTTQRGTLHPTWPFPEGTRDGGYLTASDQVHGSYGEKQAWDVLLPAISVTPADAAGRGSRLVYFDHFTEAHNIMLDVQNEVDEAATCVVKRVPISTKALLHLHLFEPRPGAFGPISVGATGAELLAMGVVEASGATWANKGWLIDEGITLSSKDGDTLDQITIDTTGRWNVPLDPTVEASKLPEGYRAVELDVNPEEAEWGAVSKWVVFSDAGALTIWLDADAWAMKAAMTAGTDLDSYQPPVLP